MKEKSKASKFVSLLIKFCFLPVSIEEDVIKFKISKAIFHIIIYPGFCVANLLFVRFYFKKWIFSNLIVAKGFVESLAILMYYSTSGKAFILWSSGKGKGIGSTQEVTQRSFIDYRLSIIDIDFPMLYTKFGCVTFPPPPPPASL